MARRARASSTEHREDEDEKPFEECPENGLVCARCGEPQRTTPSGDTCGEHGGADGVTREEYEAQTKPKRKPIGEATSTPETRAAAREEKANAKLDVGPGVFPSGDEGELVTATSAECLYTPKQFNAFRVGPFVVQTRVRAGETHADALRRAQKSVEKIHAEAFEAKLASFVAEFRKAEGALR